MTRREWLVLPGMTQVFLRYLSMVKEYLSGKSTIHNKPLMIIGDSGVGKGLFIDCARQIFESAEFGLPSQLPRQAKPFLRINCASFTKELADSEIFGHEKGAFTGATKEKIGIVEEANGGLLVLDEIGELPEVVQAKILIFIEEGEFRRVGSNKIRRSDVFIIGTTNQRQGSFRPDFWYRFFPVFIPALYERRLDVLYYIALKYPKIFSRLTPQHALSLLAHNWPGNIRELERVISIIMSEDLMRESQLSSGTDVKKESMPLVFPVDTRQTSLAEMYLSRFCSDLLAANFNIKSFNLIVSSYGLQIPYSFASANGFEEIKKVYAELSSTSFSYIYNNLTGVADGNNKNQKSNEKSYIDHSSIFLICPELEKEKNVVDFHKSFEDIIDVSSLLVLIQQMQNTINDESSFYLNLKIDFDNCTKSVENLEKVYLISRDSRIENIGVCFSCVCDIFLKNKASPLNVFDEADVHLAGGSLFGKVRNSIMTAFEKAGLISESLEYALGKKLIFDKKYRVEVDWGDYVKSVLINNDICSGDVEINSVAQSLNECESILYKVTEEELLVSYYRYLRSKYSKVVQVCKHAGLNNSTCRNQLRKYGLLPKQMKEGANRLK
uniref:Response regulator with CheY-like receiver, AAA-type ATPase, and DNA-binding domains n=1 Tax=Desulfovibrio sp. U5L TaxID=596152 RepID=I2Q6H5_9BACT